MAGRIFINYRRGDDPGHTGRLFDRLQEVFFPEELFMDVENIDPGLDYRQVLKEQVAKCDVLLAVIGRGWIDARDSAGNRRLDSPSDLVRLEIEEALNLGKRVIPVLVGGASLPRPHELPESIRGLSARHAVRLTHERFKLDSQGLIESLHKALGEIEAQRLRRANGVIERKHATALFADIVGSTELIASLDPEQAMETLRPAVATMCETVQRFEGTVVRTLGDGIMALFGAPRAQEGHAFLACAAAIALQEAFPPGDAALAIRIGLHSGEVVSDATREQGAHGMTIHLASRMEQLAEPRQICLTGECYRLVRPYCDVRSLGKQRPKGALEAVEVYCLLGLKPAVASQQFQTTLSSFRGRAGEIARLEQALDDTEQGNTKVVGIVAPPGTGKSRLCYEFAEACRTRLIPVLEARASIYGAATPLQPVLEFLRLFFRISPKDDAATARRRVEHRLAGVDASFAADLPLIYDFLGIPDAAAAIGRLDPKVRQSRLLDLIRRIVRRIGPGPSVIIVEDLHWLDEASEEFVAMLVEAVAGTRIMLVVNYRPGYAASWMGLPHFNAIALGELGTAEIEDVVKELAGAHPSLRDLSGEIAARSGGNPFFAEELVRSLVDAGALSGTPGDYRLSPVLAGPALPGTVQAVIGARIDRLSAVEKEVLQVASVIGREFPLFLLENVAHIPPVEIKATLNRLCEVELVQEWFGPAGQQFAFRHPLVQEVAYGMLLRRRRGELHHELAVAMERFYRDRLDEFAGLIAFHFEAAQESLAAARYAMRAAMWVGKTDSAQALKLWKKTADLLRNEAREPQIDALRIMAHGQIVNFGWREGMGSDEAKPYFEEALIWARDNDNKVAQMLVLAGYGRIIAATGAADEYVERVKEALLLLPAARNVGRDTMLNTLLSQACRLAGLLNEALAANSLALESGGRFEKSDQEMLGFNVEQILGFRLQTWILSLRGRILVGLGRFSEAHACLDQVINDTSSSFEPVVQVIPHQAYVELAWCQGDAPLARSHAARIAGIAEKSGMPYVRVCALACIGSSRVIAGEYRAGIDDFTAALSLARDAKAGLENEPQIFAGLAEAHYRAGDLAIARRIASEAIEVARRRSARTAECHACIVRAAALIGSSESEAGEVDRLLSRAEELIDATGAVIYRPLLDEARLQLSTVIRH
jgi:adenylate cyclase